MRNKYALDLLRPGISVEYEVHLMLRRRGLTQDDYDTIIANAKKVIEAAEIAKPVAQK